MSFKGTFSIQVVRNGSVVYDSKIHNRTTLEGLNELLNIGFGTTIKTSWYVGLLGGASVTFNEADTLVSHPGWTEIAGYSGNRRIWEPGAATDQSINDDVSFAVTGSATVKGMFLASVDTGTGGKLWATAFFQSDPNGTTGVNVESGDDVKINYQIDWNE